MNKYLLIGEADNRVMEIIDEFDSKFPGIAITDRYSATFLDDCVVVSDKRFTSEGIILGMLYDKETDTFKLPPEPQPITEPEGYIGDSETAI